jgi:hypothetical protein
MHQHHCDSTSIRVTADSELARWARGRSRGLAKIIEAAEVDGRPQVVFIADEILVDGKDDELINRLVEKYDAEPVARRPLPPVPRGMARKSGVDVEAMPLPTLLRLKRPPAASARSRDLVHASFSANVSLTSDRAARLIGLVAELAADGKDVGLNAVSVVSDLALLAPVDSNPTDPLSVAGYNGSARVGAAWQLIEAFREYRSTKPVTIGILDAGFWLNGFAPGVAQGQMASDLGSSVAQLNLMDFGVSAGGASGMQSTGGWNGPWHGNASASVAAARVGNGQGAAGVGGSVATPVLFKTDGSLDYYFDCLRICLDWGIDVLNISLGYSVDAEFWFPTTAWHNAFKYASDAGLIMVVSAGNDFARIPEDKNVRPATRTPGTITVGALDTPLDGVERAKEYSNFGSSINVWAPTDIPAIPDPNNPIGRNFGGTSCSAPFVSGIMAMMRAVAPIGTLDPARAKQLLEDTGWHGTGWHGPGKVGIGVDAYAAVLAAMGGRLPDEQSESHATAQTARQLQADPNGVLMPFRLRSDPRRDALTSALHSNWYKFAVDRYSRMDLQIRFYPLLGAVSVTLEPDDELALANAEIVSSGDRASGAVRLAGVIAPGSYKVFVRGDINLYEFELRLADAPLSPDAFEPNDSFEASTRFRLINAEESLFVIPSFAESGGRYDLTLHTAIDQDFFRVEPVVTNPLSVPTLGISMSELPVDITIFDDTHQEIGRESGKRSTKITLPRDRVSFIRVSGSQPTRYRMTLRLEVDQAHLPGPLQEEVVTPLPDLGDPAFAVDHGMSHLIFQAEASQNLGIMRFSETDGKALKVELLDDAGHVVRAAERRDGSLQQSVALDVSDLAPGAHILRIGHADAQVGSGAAPLNVQRVPSFG